MNPYSETSGMVTRDKVKFGAWQIKDQIFGEAEQGATFREMPFDGILGLAFKSISVDDMDPGIHCRDIHENLLLLNLSVTMLQCSTT